MTKKEQQREKKKKNERQLYGFILQMRKMKRILWLI
jgi:hypothetical protein